jgi:protein-S-isoprenylcysteine O-methyltransferase Ste14
MRPLFAHDPAVWIMIGASLILWNAVELALGGRASSQGRSAPEWSFFCIALLVCGSLGGSIAASLGHVATIAGPRWWPVIAGLVLIWAGLAFRAWAISTLGRFFKVMVVIQEDHRVIERGPYRRLRHPSYLGSIVAMTGLGLAEGDWVSMAVMLLGTLSAFLIRIRVEERTLLHELGDEYAAYTQRTARLMPGVY